MRQFFLSLLFLPALCAQAWNYDFPTLEDATTYNAPCTGNQYAPIAAPSVISPDGTIYQTGLYDQMLAIEEDFLENIATSAFLSAVDATTQKPRWTVGIKGAAHIRQVITDATGDYIYVSGTFADDVVFGSTDFVEQSFTGTEFSHEKVNGFVAKYSKAGVLQSVLPIIPHKNPRYATNDSYESDLAVTPTALAIYDGKLYISMTYMGGYQAGTLNKNGTALNAQGVLLDCLCGAVLTWSEGTVKEVLDFRNSDAVSTTGLSPQSICLAAADDAVYVGIFANGKVKLTVNGKATNYSFTAAENQGVESGAVMVKMTASESVAQQINGATSDRSMRNNIIKTMQVVGGKIYLAGYVSTPLPFKTSLVPDLWTDQFAACLDAETFTTKWAAITGALRDDMPNMNAKYRQTTDAALVGNDFVVVGSTNFLCDAKGNLSEYSATTQAGASSDFCLGISATSNTGAVATKTATGLQLSVFSYTPATPDDEPEEPEDNPYDINGDGKFTLDDINALINIYLQKQ